MEIPVDKILEKYTINAPDRSIRREIVEILKEVVGVTVGIKAVSYQKGKVYVDISPLARSQIQIHKEEILNQLSKRLTERKIKDIS